jgi:MarR family transcriptional regulator, transcriptional regulator for hemolysin
MSKMELMKDQKFVFGSIHIVANRKETLLERELKPFGITFKQWFLMVVIQNSFDKPPTLNEAAKAMGSSHQNIKKIATILEEKGYIAFEKDKKDSRSKHIRLTEASYKLSEIIQAQATTFTSTLFAGIDDDEMAKARVVLQTMMSNLAKMELNENEKENE